MKKNKTKLEKIVKKEKDNDEIINSSESFLSESKTSKKIDKDNNKEKVVLADKIKKKFESTVKETKEIVQTNKDVINPNTTKKLEEAQTQVNKSSSNVKLYFYLLCFVINIVCFSVVLFVFSGTTSLRNAIADGSAGWLIFVVFSFAIIMLLETFILAILLKRSSRRIRFAVSYKTAALGRYYDCITPLKTGGQPFQISYLYKFGEKTNSASSVPITRFVVNQFVYLISIIILLFNISKVNFSGNTTFANIVSVAAYIGIGVQFVWLLTILLLSYSKKTGPVIIIGVLKFLAWLKIIKNYRIAYVKVLRFVKEYQSTMRRCLRNFFHFFLLILFSAIIMLIKWSIPFFIYSAFYGFHGEMFFQFLALSMLLELALGFWILPGNVIFADVTFLTFFRPIFGDSKIFWALLIWRILSYYSYIVQGAIVRFYDIIKYEWMKKPIPKPLRNPSNSNKAQQKSI